jgi:hypothetical protein
MSASRRSALKQPSKQNTQKKHVRIEPEKNAVQFFFPVEKDQIPDLWTSQAEFRNATVDKRMEDLSSKGYNELNLENAKRRLLRNSHYKNVLNKANVEVKTRKNLPTLAATIARGRYPTGSPRGSPKESEGFVQLRRQPAVQSLVSLDNDKIMDENGQVFMKLKRQLNVKPIPSTKRGVISGIMNAFRKNYGKKGGRRTLKKNVYKPLKI